MIEKSLYRYTLKKKKALICFSKTGLKEQAFPVVGKPMPTKLYGFTYIYIYIYIYIYLFIFIFRRVCVCKKKIKPLNCIW